MRLIQKFYRFMIGRNGADALFYAMTITYLFLMTINVFILSWIIQFTSFFILFLTFYRYLSRNLDKRRRENYKFLGLWSSFKNFFRNKKSRAVQNKTHCFKRCPNCGKMLRLPRVKGKHKTVCPACRVDFNVRVWFNKRS